MARGVQARLGLSGGWQFLARNDRSQRQQSASLSRHRAPVPLPGFGGLTGHWQNRNPGRPGPVHFQDISLKASLDRQHSSPLNCSLTTSTSVMEKALGRELPASAENRPRWNQSNRINGKSVAPRTVVDALSQTSPESSVMPLNLINDAFVQIEDSTSLKTLVEGVENHIHHLQKTMNAVVSTNSRCSRWQRNSRGNESNCRVWI